jgi:hypothetical protein
MAFKEEEDFIERMRKKYLPGGDLVPLEGMIKASPKKAPEVTKKQTREAKFTLEEDSD